MSNVFWNISSIEGWDRIAKHVVSNFGDGDVLAIKGPLGAGKTTFVQVLARVLGAKRIPKSPTFSMLRTYDVNRDDIRRLLHVDAYRIDNEVDLLPLDLDEELHIPGTILAVEWPENIPNWLSKRKVHKLNIEMRKYGRRVEYQNK
jgi:tRNA threonylcarbamoyladenosine biosynthesis protein TsaE